MTERFSVLCNGLSQVKLQKNYQEDVCNNMLLALAQ